VRFGLVHRLMTNALATLGVLALVSSGQFSTSVSAIVLLGLVGALAVRESWQRLPGFRHVDTIALLAIVAIQVTRFVLGTSPLDVIIEFAAALQIVRLATRRGAAHDQQVIVLALLHLIAGTVLGGGLGYGLCFAGVLVVAPAALVLSHLRREVEGNYRQGARDRTGLPVDVPRILRSRRVVGRTFLITMCTLSVPIFLFTAVLFVFFPRVGLSLLLVDNQRQERMTGFNDKVDLGSVGLLRDNPTIAMRVTVEGLPDPPPQHLSLHLRGSAHDRYERGAWSRSEEGRRPEVGDGVVMVDPPRMPPLDAPKITIDLEPIDPPILFLPPDAVGFAFKSPALVVGSQSPYALRGPEGEFRYHSEERGVRYEVYRSKNGRASFSRIVNREQYLQLPRDLPDRIVELAQEWTAGATSDEDKARALEQRLKAEMLYDKASPSGLAKEPVDDFLFESKRGHCEFFSSAMALMLRAVGIPSRNVTGFGSGTYNEYGGFYVVRQGDAHSWVEAYIEGKGWVTFDPTPAAGTLPQPRFALWAMVQDFIDATSEKWRKHVVSYDLQQQVGLLKRLTSEREAARERELSRSWTLIFVAGVVLAGVGYWVLKRRRRAPEPSAPLEPKTRALVRATAIYESLEAALGAKGIHRAPGTPPLRHAENLVASAHPLADDVLSITQVYLSIRFGGMPLTDETGVDLERRVRAIRARDLRQEAP
jgi:transglutaminase-like putative cysteine protease